MHDRTAKSIAHAFRIIDRHGMDEAAKAWPHLVEAVCWELAALREAIEANTQAAEPYTMDGDERVARGEG